MTTMLVMSPEPGLRILERSLVMLERWVGQAVRLSGCLRASVLAWRQSLSTESSRSLLPADVTLTRNISPPSSRPASLRQTIDLISSLQSISQWQVEGRIRKVSL